MNSKSDLAKAYILKYPQSTIKEVAKAINCSDRQVDRAKKQLRAEGKIAPVTESKDTSFKGDENGAEYSFKTKNRIVTKEDLIKACDIDLSAWDIERWICNKWEVGMKPPAIGGSKKGWKRKNGDIIISPLFQVKLWLKPKITKKQNNMLEAIKSIADKLVTGKIKKIPQTTVAGNKAIKATLSDMHVGLDPNPNGRAIFNYVYGEKQFNDNLDKVFNSIIKERNTHGKFEILIIDDLGDSLDGWNGMTTRGGHKLEQNMDNVKQFKVYVTGKLRFIENCIQADIANKILVRNVSDCNHSGDFGYVANAAIEMLLNRAYDKSTVDFYILNKFVEHFTYGDHAFILTHGKDAKYMFKGLPLVLNDQTIKFFNDYIDHYKINSKYISVEKGDLHQISFQRTKKFTYRNYMSFAPPSSWVQSNFSDTYSGYSIQVIPKHSCEISHTDYFFEMETSN